MSNTRQTNTYFSFGYYCEGFLSCPLITEAHM